MREFVEDSIARRTFAPRQSDHIDAAVLAAGVAKRIARPADADFVLFSTTGDFYCLFGDEDVVAAVPAADITDGSSAELNPAGRQVPEDATHVSLIGPADVVVTLAWYA